MSRTEPIAFLQTNYWESPHSFESAKLLIHEKCHNQWHLLKRYLPYQEKHYPARGETLKQSLSSIKHEQNNILSTKNREQLLLLEARASKQYWASIQLLTKQPSPAKRLYPKAKDPLNKALNIGYSILGGVIKKEIQKQGLDPKIGMLHSPRNNKDALVYDLQELFRQPIVDASILPLFSRSKYPVQPEHRKIIKRVTKSIEENRPEIAQKMNSLHKALTHNIVYKPKQHSWAHKKYKPRLRKPG